MSRIPTDVQIPAVEWACPACGEQNLSVIGTPCGHCGSGGGAKFVGVDPIVRKGETRDPLHGIPAMGAVDELLTQRPVGVDRVAFGFAQWLNTEERPAVELSAEVYALLLRAFRAGVEWHREQQMTSPVTPPIENAPVAVPRSERSNRTIVAALKLFKDQILSQLSKADLDAEEYEWLHPEEVDELIRELEGEGAEHE
jgi:hypothetical protein